MKLVDIIREELGRIKINESYIDKNGNLIDMDIDHDKDGLVDFKSFPPSVLNTLDNEYGDYDNNFDWNSEQDKYKNNPNGFTKFLALNKSDQFKKNINNIIRMCIQDMIIKRKQIIAKKKLADFEELIIPVLGNDILCKKLTKYEEMVLMDTNATPESIDKGFIEAKNIIDSDGNINPLKTELSTIFVGNQINYANFERFIERHPEYQKTYNMWKKLDDDYMKLSLKELNAFRSSTSYERIKELRDFLINYRNNNKI